MVTRRSSMNTSLKNARIFEDLCDDASDFDLKVHATPVSDNCYRDNNPAPHKLRVNKVEDGVKSKRQKLSSDETTECSSGSIKTEHLEPSCCYRDTVINKDTVCVKTEPPEKTSEFSFEAINSQFLEPSNIYQDAASERLEAVSNRESVLPKTEHSTAEFSFGTIKPEHLEPSTSYRDVVKRKRADLVWNTTRDVVDENSLLETRDGLLGNPNSVKHELFNENTNEEVSRDSCSLKSNKRTVFTRNSPYQKLTMELPKDDDKVNHCVRNLSLEKTLSPRKYELEQDAEVLSRRQKQIDFGKNTIGYDKYIRTVPRYKRTLKEPRTPDKYRKCSRRGWDALIKHWRVQLHNYD